MMHDNAPPPRGGRLARLFSADSLTKKASLNAFAAGADYAARLLVGFVINPLLVTGLGNYGYGAWQILLRVVSYVGPASGRTTQALKTTIANRQASIDYVEKRRLVGSAMAVWLLFLPGLFVGGAVLCWFAPAWLKASADYALTVRIAAVVLVLDAILTSLADLPRSVVEGENLAYKRLGLSTFLLLLGGGLIALALYLRTGLVGVACATLVGTALTGLFFLNVARIYVPWFGATRPSRSDVGRFLGLSGWFLAWSFVMKLMRGADVVVLGLGASVEIVTTYTLTKYLPETLTNFVSIFVFSISPGLGRVIGAGDLEKARRVRAEVMSLTWLIVTSAGATILLWNRSFVGLWVGSQHDAGTVSTLLIILLATQFILIRNDANIIDLTLDLRRKVVLGLVSVALSLTAAAVLVGPLGLGIPGLCIGFAGGRVLLSVAYPWIVGRHLGLSSRTQLQAIARPVLVTAILLGLAFWFGGKLNARTWPILVISTGLTAVAAFAAAFYGGLAGRLRSDLVRRIRNMI